MGAPSSRTSVYLAAPLFTDAECEFNARLAARVFLPQRDSPPATLRALAPPGGRASERTPT